MAGKGRVALGNKARPRRPPSYLLPYARAHQEGARSVEALLWEDRRSQEVRFEALARNCALAARTVLDVGCGRAELLSYLEKRGVFPESYIGLEAQPWLARAARRRRLRSATIVLGDFVRDPSLMQAGAEVVVFSGSLNFLPSRQFYRSLSVAWKATGRSLAFNFLCSPSLTAEKQLRWHHQRAVLAFARRRTPDVRIDDGYEEGDCTVVMNKRAPR
jgi:hypothetical protein